MKLDDVLDMWDEDSRINKFDLGETSIDTSILHAKYLRLLMDAKSRLKQAEFSQNTLLKKKFLYYEKSLTDEEVLATGWEINPFHGHKILKGEMKYYYDSDIEIQQSEAKVAYFKLVIESLTQIIDVLKWRHQTVKNVIEWRKFEAGN